MESHSARGHVLVVDDDPDLRAALREFLSLEGFQVDVACDGLDALDQLDDSNIAIVCDLDMPRLDGATLLRRLRRSGRDTVVIVLSGRFDLLGLASEFGHVYALAKPVEPERLSRTLREALEGRC